MTMHVPVCVVQALLSYLPHCLALPQGALASYAVREKFSTGRADLGGRILVLLVLMSLSLLVTATAWMHNPKDPMDSAPFSFGAYLFCIHYDP